MVIGGGFILIVSMKLLLVHLSPGFLFCIYFMILVIICYLAIIFDLEECNIRIFLNWA